MKLVHEYILWSRKFGIIYFWLILACCQMAKRIKTKTFRVWPDIATDVIVCDKLQV